MRRRSHAKGRFDAHPPIPDRGFNRRFFNKTKYSLQTVRKWNQVYHPYMKEVQMRVLAERADDFSGSTDLHQTIVKKALKVSPFN